MMRFLNSGIGRFRAIAFLEGISFILLLFIAMPLKYGAGEPLLVKWVGMAHGLLFVLFLLLAVQQHVERGWSFLSVTWKVIASSLIPFGTFYLDRRFLSPLHT
ncbi:MAG: DUF3817 domain-containing protein [Flavobacteriales bacterium]|nr:DUF3817 domain-containing protein [Flavobacteriales bacterium]